MTLSVDSPSTVSVDVLHFVARPMVIAAMGSEDGGVVASVKYLVCTSLDGT